MDEIEKQKKQKSKIINGIKRNLKKQRMFHYLTKHVGKGVRGSLKKVYVADQNQKIIKTQIEKE